MKKSLLALAVLSAFAGAASAQSSVTLSGGIDMAVQRTNGAWNMSTGNSGRSNFTLSGREDLGGGMNTFFALNYRFNPGTGQGTSAYTSSSFWRQLWVGLGGGFGDVRLGRMLPVLQEFNGGFDPFGTETIGSTHSGGLNAGTAGSARNNNTIYYRSPNLGGLQLHANISAGDSQQISGSGSTATFVSTGERPLGLGAIYAAGPLRLAVAYDKNGLDQKTKGLYGAYNFGVAEVMGQWEKGDVQINPATSAVMLDTTVWSLGARVPVGAATFKVGYRKFTDAIVGTVQRDQKKLGLGVDYNLSKRTIIYSDVAKQSGTFSLTAATDSAAKKAQFDVGIWHKF